MQLGDDCFSPELRAFWASLSAPERQNLLRVPKSDLFKRVTAISCGRCYGLFALRRALGSPDHKDKDFSLHIYLGPMISAWEPLCGAGQPIITIHVYLSVLCQPRARSAAQKCRPRCIKVAVFFILAVRL